MADNRVQYFQYLSNGWFWCELERIGQDLLTGIQVW